MCEYPVDLRQYDASILVRKISNFMNKTQGKFYKRILTESDDLSYFTQKMKEHVKDDDVFKNFYVNTIDLKTESIVDYNHYGNIFILKFRYTINNRLIDDFNIKFSVNLSIPNFSEFHDISDSSIFKVRHKDILIDDVVELDIKRELFNSTSCVCCPKEILDDNELFGFAKLHYDQENSEEDYKISLFNASVFYVFFLEHKIAELIEKSYDRAHEHLSSARFSS